jgi:hypothetical protein
MMNDPALGELSEQDLPAETDMPVNKGGKTKVARSVSGIVYGATSLGNAIATCIGYVSFAMGFATVACLAGTVCVWCLLLPAFLYKKSKEKRFVINWFLIMASNILLPIGKFANIIFLTFLAAAFAAAGSIGLFHFAFHKDKKSGELPLS